MKIKENETIPNSEVYVLENGEPIKKDIENILKNRKSVIFGLPVGFVGAAESKELLVKQCKESVQFLTLNGRRGGSAMAAAAVNALTFDS